MNIYFKTEGQIVYAIILAAGTASRMKEEKLLLKFHGDTILSNMVSTVFDSGLTPIIVTGCYKDLIDQEIKRIEKNRNCKLITTHNEFFERGQLSSLIVGVKKLEEILNEPNSPDKNTPYFITVADLPLLKPYHFNNLIPLLSTHEALRPNVNGIFGHPVLLSTSINREIINLEVEGKKKEGLKSFLRKKDTLSYEIDDIAYITDIDTKENYKNLLNENT
jgi:CTP:molybdopterin cytidylyltransferase MocA